MLCPGRFILVESVLADLEGDLYSDSSAGLSADLSADFSADSVDDFPASCKVFPTNFSH